MVDKHCEMICRDMDADKALVKRTWKLVHCKTKVWISEA